MSGARITVAAAVALIVSGIGPVAAATTAPMTLTPADIKATFGTSKPFTATSATGGTPLTFTFNSDGGASQSPKGSKTTAIIGTWRLNAAGYCSKWGTNAEHCYTVQKNGARYDVLDASGQVVSHWTL